jgi:hypothetical protein
MKKQPAANTTGTCVDIQRGKSTTKIPFGEIITAKSNHQTHERPPFALQKTVFRIVKDALSACKRPPFTTH